MATIEEHYKAAQESARRGCVICRATDCRLVVLDDLALCWRCSRKHGAARAWKLARIKAARSVAAGGV